VRVQVERLHAECQEFRVKSRRMEGEVFQEALISSSYVANLDGRSSTAFMQASSLMGHRIWSSDSDFRYHSAFMEQFTSRCGQVLARGPTCIRI